MMEQQLTNNMEKLIESKLEERRSDSNIARLSQNEVYENIKEFIEKKEYRSKGTADVYHREIGKFFKVVKGKELQFLTLDDIQLTTRDIYVFVKEYFGKLNNKTINRTITSIRMLFEKQFYPEKLVTDISFLYGYERLPENKNKYDPMTVEEVRQMADYARDTEHSLGEEKRLFLLFALDTCLRKEAILSLKWSDLRKRADGYMVKAIDKGSKDYNPMIGNELYNELQTIRKAGQEKIFNFSGKTVSRMMERLVEGMAIFEDRWIVFHSVRKAGVSFQYEFTGGDIRQAQKAANHSNMNTTQDYLSDVDYGIVGAYSAEKRTDLNMIDKIDDIEVLRNIIKNDCSKAFQLQLAQKLKDRMKD